MSEDQGDHQQLSAVLRFTATPAALSGVRAAVRDQLRKWDLTAVADDAQLVVSELAGNVARHVGEGTTAKLVLQRKEACLRVEVHDQSHRLPRLIPAGSMETGGRGLHLVTGLSVLWGTIVSRTGKAVWCEMSVEPAKRSRPVERAHDALTQYRTDPFGQRCSSSSDLPEVSAIDLIADLLHWIHINGGDPDQALALAKMHFQEEVSTEAA